MNDRDLRAALCVSEETFADEAINYAMANPGPASEVSMSVLDEARRTVPNDGLNFGPIYATVLLGYHHWRPAHPILADITEGPAQVADDLWGDLITEGLCGVLWNTSGGDPTRLWGIAANAAANPWCRGAAAKALFIGAMEGRLDRRQVAERLNGILRDAADSPIPQRTENDFSFWGSLCGTLSRAVPQESEGTLRLAIDKELADGAIGTDFLDARLRRTPEENWQEYTKTQRGYAACDPLDLARWWYFRRGLEREVARQRNASQLIAAGKKEQHRQSKRAQQKKARRRNRR